jgi:hypothetical protein
MHVGKVLKLQQQTVQKASTIGNAVNQQLFSTKYSLNQVTSST